MLDTLVETASGDADHQVVMYLFTDVGKERKTQHTDVHLVQKAYAYFPMTWFSLLDREASTAATRHRRIVPKTVPHTPLL